jgi:hypothetical protein
VPRVAKSKKKAKKERQRVEEAHLAGCATLAKLPKKKCCESKTRCNRCPLRMLKEGTLPHGYTVHKRKLVTVEEAARVKSERQAQKQAKKQSKKAGKAA